MSVSNTKPIEPKYCTLVLVWLSIGMLWGGQSKAQCAVEAGRDTTICSGHNVKFKADTTGGSPTTYAWSSIPAGFTSGNRNITVSPGASTTYIISVTGNGCNAVDSVTVNVNPSPPLPVFTYNSDYLCSGTNLIFNTTIDTSLTYKWNFGDGQRDTGSSVSHTYYYYGTDTGYYVASLTVSNAWGCTAKFIDTIAARGIPNGGLIPGTGTDTTTFNGHFTFTRCILSGQISAGFNFVNNNNPLTGVTSTIIWGDTGVTWTSDTPWTTLSHDYALGKYNMTYIVSSTVNGCADTLHYVIFVGSNPSVGFGIQGSTSICGLNPIVFYIDNFQTNPQGTVYTVTYNDGTPPLVFGQPPPDSVVHLFASSSCGFSSTNGLTSYPNSYSASIVASNPCGITSASVLPIYVSYPPLPGIVNDTVCQGQPATINNATINGGYATANGCNTSASILWDVQPNTGWALVGGSLGNNNGYTGPNFDPSLWTSGSNALNIIFDSLGTYNVLLVAANGCGPDTITQSICITTPPTPAFTLTPTVGCAPFVSNAVNITPPVQGCHAVNYFWDVATLSRSCINDSVLDYKITGNPNAPGIHFYNQGIYSVTLNAQNACGSYSSIAHIDTVKDKPQITLALPGAICAGDSLLPVATVMPCTGNITGYNWTFQGAIPTFSTALDPGNITMVSPGDHAVSFSATNECGTRTLTDVVVIDTLPVANAGPDQLICADVTGQIGAPPVTGWTYIWNPPTGLSSDTVANPTVTLTNSGTAPITFAYVLTVSNAGGCSSTDTVNVTVYPNPVVHAGPSQTVCASSNVRLNGSSGGGVSSVTWSSSNGGTFTNVHSDTAVYIPGIDSGTVVLTLTGNTPGSPCADQTDTLVLTVLPIPVADAGPNQQLCSANSLQLGAAPAVGTTYLWLPATGLNSNIISNPTLILTNPGTVQDTSTYILKASNTAGCSVDDTAYIVTYPAATVYAGPPQEVCAGNSIQLAGNFGGSATSVLWTSSNGGTFSNPTSVNSTYIPSITIGSTILTLTTNIPPGPCPAVNNRMIVTVNPTPVAKPGPDDTVCNGITAQLGAPSQAGYTYNWSPSIGLTDTTVSNPAAVLTNTGNGVINQAYTLVVSANGCKDTGHVSVAVFPTPAVNADPAVGLCSGGSVMLSATASGAGAYTWSSSSGTFSAPDSLNTLFTPNISNGVAVATISVSQIPAICPSTSSGVNVSVNPIPVANPGSNDSVCNGAEAQLGGASMSGYVYHWSPATGLTDSSVSNPGLTLTDTGAGVLNQTYRLIVSLNGCYDTAHVSVSVFPTPVVNTGPGASICPGDSALLSAIASGANVYLWSSSSGTFSQPDSLSTRFIPNITNGVAVATLTIYPAAGVCPVTSSSVDVSVNAVPALNSSFNQNVCSGTAMGAINLSSNQEGTTFMWTAISTDGVTGFDSTGTNNIIPGQVLVNNSPDTGMVIYDITAMHSGCTSAGIYDTIRVLPVPDILLPVPQTICSGGTTAAVAETSSVPNTTFSWTATGGNNLSGFTNTGTGNIPAQTIVNSGSNTDSIVYVINSSATGCSSVPGNYIIRVEPAPQLIFTPSAQTVCSGQATQTVNITSNVPNANISWTAIVPAGIAGADTSGSTSIASQTFYNNNADILPEPLTIDYQVQISTNGFACAGAPGNYSISVEPVPSLSFVQTQSAGCSPFSVNFLPVSSNYGPPDSLTFVWGDNTPNTVLHPNAIAPEWTTTSHVFYNINNQPDTFDVQLIARSQCMDTTITHTIVVLPGVVNAFFTDSPATGCEPLTVTFHDESTGAGLLNWCLNYNPITDSCIGPGRVDSAGTTFSHTFNAGTYTVALIAEDGYQCAVDTEYQTITVIPAPTVHFTFADSVCADNPVIFTNQTTVPSGTIAQVTWNFGNGDSTSVNSPVQTYHLGGIYHVCLNVTNSFGCADSLCKPLIIINKPAVGFTLTDTCLNAQPVAFLNTSTGAASYYWSFGDGTFSFVQNPVHDYAVAGNYSVTLVGSAMGCADTITQTAAVYPVPVATFTLASSYNCGLPANVQLTNTTAGTNAYTWIFGNGITSTQLNPVATYNATGTFDIKLAAVNTFGCADTGQNEFVVYPMPVIDSINILPVQGCQPLNVQFEVTGDDLNKLFWNFGDGSTLTTNSGFTSHYYGDTGTYSVQVTAYSDQNCNVSITLKDTIVVHVNPVAAFDYYINENIDPENGTTEFYNQSQNSTSYLWNFGDGTTSTDVNPVHMFTQSNYFNVLLVAMTPYGCIDSVYKSIYIIEKSLYVPNVLAPDFNEGSALVKLWQPAGMGLAEYHAQVFNKWGELLWESNVLTKDHQPAEGWDGTYQGKVVQQDAYVWKVEAVFLDGTRWEGMSYKFQKERKTIGSVTVIR